MTAFDECDAAESVLPAIRQSCSRDAHWQSVLARTYREVSHADEFVTVPTENLLLVLVTGGTYAIHCRTRAGWDRTVYRPGSLGTTSPGNESALRWTSLGAAPLTSFQMYISPEVFADVGIDGDALAALPDALDDGDPVLGTICASLARALERKASALYADSAVRFLAAHIAERLPAAPVTRSASGLGPRALGDVVDFMTAHLAEEMTLDALSDLAGLSKHHFLRSFSASTGMTPHRFLVDLRMRRAAELLTSTSRTVAAIGAQCGYRSASHFAVAFRHTHGCSPTAYRSRDGSRPSHQDVDTRRRSDSPMRW